MLWHRFGPLGLLGFLILAAWLIGFLVLGFHGGFFHVLFPVGLILCIAQYVRRLAA